MKRKSPTSCTRGNGSILSEFDCSQALRNIEIMLSCNVVHSDLSAYNMLYSGGNLRIIDLPQAVDARTSRHAKSLLVRDVANVCDYFAAQVADAEPGTFAEELWDLYLRAGL
jgi:RIO kinase 1